MFTCQNQCIRIHVLNDEICLHDLEHVNWPAARAKMFLGRMTVKKQTSDFLLFAGN